LLAAYETGARSSGELGVSQSETASDEMALQTPASPTALEGGAS